MAKGGLSPFEEVVLPSSNWGKNPLRAGLFIFRGDLFSGLKI